MGKDTVDFSKEWTSKQTGTTETRVGYITLVECLSVAMKRSWSICENGTPVTKAKSKRLCDSRLPWPLNDSSANSLAQFFPIHRLQMWRRKPGQAWSATVVPSSLTTHSLREEDHLLTSLVKSRSSSRTSSIFLVLSARNWPYSPSSTTKLQPSPSPTKGLLTSCWWKESIPCKKSAPRLGRECDSRNPHESLSHGYCKFQRPRHPTGRNPQGFL